VKAKVSQANKPTTQDAIKLCGWRSGYPGIVENAHPLLVDSILKGLLNKVGDMNTLINLLFWLTGFILIGNYRKFKAETKSSTAEQYQSQSQTSKISVIIPARNEEAVIGNLLDSIYRQSVSPHEVIVVNDHSTDRTVQIARSYGALIIDLEDIPEDWIGKPWACWNGAKAATGTHFLFLDADTWLEEDGMEYIHQSANQARGVLTFAPYHRVEETYENFSAFFNLAAAAGLKTFTVLGDKIKPGGVFGPCILCSREDYYAIDGHTSVKSSSVEDLQIGQNWVSAGIPVHGYSGKGIIAVRMYPGGINHVIEGWTKNISLGAGLVLNTNRCGNFSLAHRGSHGSFDFNKRPHQSTIAIARKRRGTVWALCGTNLLAAKESRHLPRMDLATIPSAAAVLHFDFLPFIRHGSPEK
jgi:hypothetical protein